MTLAQLDSKWPSKEIGVNIRYVQDVEAGKKQITSIETLRKLASLLDIPLWKFGLSEYDPFNENTVLSHAFIDIGGLYELIENVWYIRLNMPSDITEKKITSLSNLFDNLIKENSRLLGNSDFLVLYTQVKRLQEVAYTEKHNYEMSLKCSLDMLDLAKQSGDIVSDA